MIVICGLTHPAPAMARRLPLGDEVRRLTRIGFAAREAALEVAIRSSDPLRYLISRPRPNTVVVTLANARLSGRRAPRAWRSRRGVGAVAQVTVAPIEDVSPSVQIEVRTRGPVEVRPAQRDTLLTIAFAAPSKPAEIARVDP